MHNKSNLMEFLYFLFINKLGFTLMHFKLPKLDLAWWSFNFQDFVKYYK